MNHGVGRSRELPVPGVRRGAGVRLVADLGEQDALVGRGGEGGEFLLDRLPGRDQLRPSLAEGGAGSIAQLEIRLDTDEVDGIPPGYLDVVVPVGGVGEPAAEPGAGLRDDLPPGRFVPDRATQLGADAQTRRSHAGGKRGIVEEERAVGAKPRFPVLVVAHRHLAPPVAVPEIRQGGDEDHLQAGLSSQPAHGEQAAVGQ